MKSISEYCRLIMSEEYTLQTQDVVPMSIRRTTSCRRLIDVEMTSCVYGEDPRNIYDGALCDIS